MRYSMMMNIKLVYITLSTATHAPALEILLLTLLVRKNSEKLSKIKKIYILLSVRCKQFNTADWHTFKKYIGIFFYAK